MPGRLDDDGLMAEKPVPAEPKKIHGDKLARALESLVRPPDEEPGTGESDVRLLSRHPAAKPGHVVRR